MKLHKDSADSVVRSGTVANRYETTSNIFLVKEMNVLKVVPKSNPK